MRRMSALLPLALAAGCGGAPAAPEAAPSATSAPPKMARDAFNRGAQANAVPLFWRADSNGDGWPDADEVVVLWGPGTPKRSDWFANGQPTPALWAAMKGFGQAAGSDDPKEAARLEKLTAEMALSRPTLAEVDLSGLSTAEKAMVGHLLAAGRVIDRLYARQKGALRHADAIASGDPLSQAVFFRNQGPWCVGPDLDADPDCSALPSRPAKRFGLYPDAIQADGNFCKTIAARPDARALLHQFSAVVATEGGDLKAVPYHEHFGEDMRAVARSLEAAAKTIEGVASEAALRTYLLAAADAFRTNNWPAADEAWAAMNARNSKWYLRVGPDETYFEPCNEKAAFHMTLARIDQGSLKWQDTLDPLKGDMEKALAALAGAPYVARTVDFHLPDFIHIALNAGDDRNAFGATIGQSLPNWGPVANEGRGRTVAMTNLYTDADSKRLFRQKAESVLCADAMAHFSVDDGPDVLGTVLHEAAHNLGPAHDYAVDGKKDGEVFGGPLAATLEEFKAQTAALYFTEWLAARKVIDRTLANQAHVRSLLWAMGQQSNGLYTGEGRVRPYPQLATMQIGTLTDAGVLVWREAAKAANGEDTGCYGVDFEKLAPAVETLMARVARIKATGDKADAEAIKARYVDAKDALATRRDEIQARWRRAPKTTFVYSVSVE